MRKRKVIEAMDRLVGPLSVRDYSDAQFELNIAVERVKWTKDRWERRRTLRAGRAPLGHDHAEWI